MSAARVIKHLYDGSLKLVDGTTPTPLECTPTFTTGTFKASGMKASLRETQVYETRGVLRSLRKAKRRYISGSFEMYFSEFTEASAGTVIDFITAKAATPYSSRASTTPGDVFTCDLVFSFEGTDLGDTDGTFTLEDCEVEFDFNEGEPNSITINFTCYGEITGDIAIAA